MLDRMLTACGPLLLEEVVAGLARATRYAPASTCSVPAGTLLAYLASQPAYRTDGDTVSLTGSGGGVLTASDRAIVGAFAGPAAWMSTGELVCALKKAGLSPKGAQALVGLSPLLRRVRPGVNALRGSRHR